MMLLGRMPWAAANASTRRLKANVLTDITAGTPSISATQCPHGANESEMT